MSVFEKIDDKLGELAQSLNTTLTKDRPSFSRSLIDFEERRMDWKDGGINKAILIQPTFEEEGVNSNTWNFSLVAWEGNTTEKFYHKVLVEKKSFKIIESSIDELLTKSLEIMSKIDKVDLQEMKFYY